MSFEVLNSYLATNSYLGSDTCATREDYKTCVAIKAGELNAKEFPHLCRWHSHIAALMTKNKNCDWRGFPLPEGKAFDFLSAARVTPALEATLEKDADVNSKSFILTALDDAKQNSVYSDMTVTGRDQVEKDDVADDINPKITVTMQKMSGETFNVQCRALDDGAILLQRVAEAMGIPEIAMQRVCLLLKEDILLASDTLISRGIFDGTVVQAIIRPPMKIYCMGGWNGSQQHTHAECFDFSLGTWKAILPMSPPRAGFGMVVFDGKVFVIGGFDGHQKLASASAYDIATAVWTSLPDMSVRRTCPCALLIEDRIHVWGGKDSVTLNSCEVLDCATNTWSPSSPMPSGRELFSAAILEGRIYFTGGYNHVHGYLCSVDSCDINEISQWTSVSQMSEIRAEHGSASLGGKLYVIGGTNNVKQYSSGEIFDPDSNAWTAMPEMPLPRSSAPAAVVYDKIYVFGGMSRGREIIRTIDVFDPTSCMWESVSTLPPMIEPRCLQGITVVAY